MHIMAVLLLEEVKTDWAALASMLGILIGISSIVGVLISKVVVKPMIDTAKDEVSAKIDEIAGTMVSKDVFEAYMVADKGEHGEMKVQLTRIFDRLDHTR